MPATRAEKPGAQSGATLSFRTRLLDLLRLLVLVGGVLYVFSRFIPAASMNDYPVNEDVDNSWTLALHDAFARHLQFGSDIIFTYGPWGFLARGYYPATYLTDVIVWAMLSVAFLIAGRRLARNFSANHFVSWLWLVGLAAVASTPLGNDFDIRLVVWVTMLLCLHFFVEREGFTLNQALLAGSLGCLALVKFTGLIEAVAVLSVITVNDVIRHRRIPGTLLIWLIALFSFWLLAGQHLGSFWMYLHNSWQITSGYSDAMGKFDVGNLGVVLFFLSIAAALVVVTARVGWVGGRFWGFLPAAGLGALLFITFKLGYVRHDTHELTSAMALLAITILLLAVIWPLHRTTALATLSVGIGAAVLAGIVFNSWLPRNGLLPQLGGTLSPSNLLAPVASTFTGYLRDDYGKNMTLIKGKFPLPPLDGGVDLYSHDQAIIFAHGLPYQPRPIIQSYSAYTPELARLNADWLRSDHAARNVLFAVQPIDNRFPSLDDGLSWPELLSRYDVKEIPDNKFLLLTRSTTPREYHLLPIQNITAGFGDNVVVPAATNGPVWVELEINKSLQGKLASTLYKAPTLFITVIYSGHEPHIYRLVPGMARAGFLLSPVITDTHVFVSLATPGRLSDLDAQMVTSVKITADTSSSTTASYEPSFQFRFFRLDFSEPSPSR